MFLKSKSLRRIARSCINSLYFVQFACLQEALVRSKGTTFWWENLSFVLEKARVCAFFYTMYNPHYFLGRK